MKARSLRITLLAASIACAFSAHAGSGNGPGDDVIGGTTSSSTATATSGNSTATSNPSIGNATGFGSTTFSPSSSATGGNVVGSGNSAANGGDAKSYSTVGDLVNRQHQNASAKSEGSESSSGGNTLSVNNQEVRQKLQAPNMAVGYASPSHACALTAGFALSVPGGGGSVGGSKVDESCARREWFRLLADTDPTTAYEVACADPLLSETKRCKTAKPAAASAPAAMVPATRTAMVGGRH